MDSSQLIDLGFKVVVGISGLTGVLWLLVKAIRRSNRGEKTENRVDRAGDTMSVAYERLVASHRNELDRMEGKLARLEDTTAKQNAALQNVVFELRVARQDRNEMSAKLREVKEAQTKLVDEGELTSPIVDITTRMATGWSHQDDSELERRMREGPTKR